MKTAKETAKLKAETNEAVASGDARAVDAYVYSSYHGRAAYHVAGRSYDHATFDSANAKCAHQDVSSVHNVKHRIDDGEGIDEYDSDDSHHHMHDIVGKYSMADHVPEHHDEVHVRHSEIIEADLAERERIAKANVAVNS